MNPELRRNLWLEITTHRLLAMPVVLGLTFIAIAAVDEADAAERIGWLGLMGFGVLTLLWGTRLAANSILDEMADKTWDWQRLSTLGPWTMSWGKLFGSTAFAWYGGLICLAVFLATAQTPWNISPFKTALTLILLAILLHGGSMALALHASRKTAGSTAPNRRSIGVLLLLVALYSIFMTFFRAMNNTVSVHWYGHAVDVGDFALFSVAMFAAWAVTGTYRTMCQSLAVRTTPWVWLSFLAFLTFYCAGFMMVDVGGERVWPLQIICLSGLLWSVILTYLMLFTEPSSPVVVRRVLQKAKGRQWRRLFEEVPLWPLTLVCAAVFAITLAALGADSNYTILRELSLAPIPFVLLLARDAGLLMFFSAASQPKRAVGATLVYILVLNWILPGLLFAVGLKDLARILLPLGWGDNWVQIASAAVQAGIAGGLAYRRIKANLSSYRHADGA